ncbi:MAG TPA: hypothetical protein VM597_40855, partial [Gemmataceae bacterium]|nr:hypothetical protein [Gemmataceae bacterium]
MSAPGSRPPMSDEVLAAARPLLDHLLDVLGRTPAGRAEAVRFAREFADLARAVASELERTHEPATLLTE